MAEQCLGCKSENTIVKCGRMVGGKGSVPYKRVICRDCTWRGAMEEMPEKPEPKK